MKTVEILMNLDWFSHVGQPFSDPRESMSFVTSWNEAVTSCSDPAWEFVCTEARNEVTMQLNTVCKQEFQR